MVGLVVTLTIVVTLSGLAAIYYESVAEEQRTVIATNDVDDYAKAVRAYILRRNVRLSPDDPTPKLWRIDELDDPQPAPPAPQHPEGYVADDCDEGYHLGFLVDAGYYREIKLDPWGHLYRFDPNGAVVYSLGEGNGDACKDAFNDIRRSYSGVSGTAGEAGLDVIPRDEIPPVISSVTPVGVIKISNPVVRAAFSDHFGGTIPQDATNPLLFVDQREVRELALSGSGTKDTSSAGQVSYTTNGLYTEGPHVCVVQVKDEAGNIARREWTFIIDTIPAQAKMLLPVQGSAIRGTTVVAEAFATDDNLRKVTMRLDFGNVTSNFRGVPPTSPAGMLPPQNGEATVYHGRWFPVDTTKYQDGLHYFTVSAEDDSGRVVSEQNVVLIDNQPPTLSWVLAVDPFAQPPTATDSQVITTNVPHFEVRGRDNIQIKRIHYRYEDVGTGLQVGRQGSVVVTGPQPMVPIEWKGIPVADWQSLFNSTDEHASTTASSLAVYTPVTVPPGTIELVTWAEDLAGNLSSVLTTRFIVDLAQIGLSGLALVDRPKPAPASFPGVAGRTISALNPNSLPLSGALYSNAEHTAYLRYDLLRAQPGSLVDAEISDWVTSTNVAGYDKRYTPYTNSSRGDWKTTASMPLTSGATTVDQEYYVFGPVKPDWDPLVNHLPGGPAPAAFRRDNNETSNIPGGEYEARVTLRFASGPPKSAITTFYMDAAFPDYQAPSTLQYETAFGNFVDVGAVIPSLTSSAVGGLLRLGGRLTDSLGGSVSPLVNANARVVQVQGRLISGPAALTPPPITDPAGWVDVFPKTGAAPPSKVATYGWIGGAPGDATKEAIFTLQNANPAALDGNYVLDLKAVDGGGHTTAWRRAFAVNTVGPIIQNVTIENAYPTVVSLNSSSPTVLSTIQDPFVRFTISASDEQAISRIEFRILEIGGVSTLGTSIIPVPCCTNFYTTPIPVVQFRDQVGSVFRSPPSSYRVEVFGVNNANVAGPLFVTNLEFRFLVDLAIFAPLYGIATQTPLAMSKKEQEAIADYLVDNVENVRSLAIYNRDGLVTDQPSGSGETDIRAWLSTNRTDGNTDVLVVLDGLSDEMKTPNGSDDLIEDFLESGDGNAMVWCGNGSFYRKRYQDGSDTYVNGTNTPAGLIEGLTQLFDFSGTGTSVNPHADEVDATKQIYQRPTAKARMLLPSLAAYRIDALAGSPTTDHYVLKGPQLTPTPVGSQGEWEANLEYFTRDSHVGADPAGEVPFDGNANLAAHSGHFENEGANLVFREDAGGRLAIFYSYGPKDFGGDRKPVAAAGPVIEEFIENFLTAEDQPDAVEARIGFVGRRLGGQCVPTVATDEVDALLFPKFSAPQARYFSLTNGLSGLGSSSVERHAAVVRDITPDGGQLLVASRQIQDTDGLIAFGLEQFNSGVYVIGSDGNRKALYKNLASEAFTTQPKLFARLASDVTKAIVIGPTVQSGSFSGYVGGLGEPNYQEAVWLFDLGSLQALQVSTVPGSTFPLGTARNRRAAISADGRYVVHVSDMRYPASAGPGNSFAGATTTSPLALVRFDTGSSPPGSYLNGYVNDPAYGSANVPSGEPGDFFQHVEPMDVAVSRNGNIVVWTARPTSAGYLNDTPQLLISVLAGGSWTTGKITDCTVANPCGFGTILVDADHHLDMTDGAIEGSFPYVLFATKANFRKTGNSCGSCSTTDVHLAAGTAPNATAHAKRALYLWRGSFSNDQFVNVALSADGDIRNGRISADGQSFVFELDGHDLVGLFGWDPDQTDPDLRRVEQRFRVTEGGTLKTMVWDSTNLRKVVRGRLRRSSATGFGFSSILQIVAPNTDTVASDIIPFTSVGAYQITTWSLPVISN